MPIKEPDTIWTVVVVESGVPVALEAYRDEPQAELRKVYWESRTNENDDAVAVFEIEIGAPSED